MTEHLADRAEDGRIHHELAGFRRTRDEAAGAACALAAEIVGAECGGVGEGTQLGGDFVHDLGTHDVIDDDASVFGEDCANLVG